jgi:uncharacterized membrane protein
MRRTSSVSLAWRRSPAVLIALAASGLINAATAGAKPEFHEILLRAYPAYSGPLASRSCANCHVSDSDFTRNAFGKELAVEMAKAGTKSLSVSLLRLLEPLDADGDGATNIEEIRAGTAPGDASSGGSAALRSKARPIVEPSAAAPPPPKKSWVPKNGYHPAIVHFPIALFIAGLGLDLLGMLRRSSALLLAGWYNLVLATISSAFAIATGVLALKLTRLPLKGIILNHMLLAISSTIIMCGLVALRAHRHEKMRPGARLLYYALAAAGLCLISYSGHLGGVFVYGD